MPRILFLDQSGALGGAELYLLDLADAYRETSHTILFENGPFFERLQAEGLSSEVVSPPAGVLELRKQAGLRTFVRALPGLVPFVKTIAERASQYDLLFANTQKALVIGGLAGLWANRPVVWNLHDLLTADHFSCISRWSAVLASNLLTQHVIANSKASCRAYETAGGRTPTSIVYNGIDPAPFEAVRDDDVTALRRSLNLSEAPIIGGFSRLATWKGQHVLIEAAAQRPDVQILLVGDALFEGDHAYTQTLRSYIRTFGMTDRVHFLGFRDDIPTIMKLCDIVVHTSTAPEPFGRVIVEGMLAGRPVVATKAGGAPEIINDGQTGRLVPPNDASALYNCLNELLDDPHHAQTLAKAGKQHARTTFAPKAMLNGIDRVLDMLA